MKNSNILYVVSTPIGNLEDISYRAVRILKEASLILAEDTRHSMRLFDNYGITTHAKSFHDFNKEKVSERYIEHLKNEGDIALISDAGTPGVADPGFYLVREAIRNDIRVEAIPGASALLTALVSSGLPTDRFAFEGFAPKKSAQRIRKLEELKESPYTICMYASPHSLTKFLAEIKKVMGGEFKLSLMRELTKKFEEHLHGSADELIAHYQERKPKGEYVVLFHPTKS